MRSNDKELGTGAALVYDEPLFRPEEQAPAAFHPLQPALGAPWSSSPAHQKSPLQPLTDRRITVVKIELHAHGSLQQQCEEIKQDRSSTSMMASVASLPENTAPSMLAKYRCLVKSPASETIPEPAAATRIFKIRGGVIQGLTCQVEVGNGTPLTGPQQFTPGHSLVPEQWRHNN